MIVVVCSAVFIVGLTGRDSLWFKLIANPDGLRSEVFGAQCRFANSDSSIECCNDGENRFIRGKSLHLRGWFEFVPYWMDVRI